MNASKLKKWLRRIFWTVAVSLVALVVLAFVMNLFLPLLGVAREPARRSNCQSNLRQIGIALSMYAEEYQGRLPVDNATNPMLIGSMKLLSNVLTSARVYACPSQFLLVEEHASSYNELGITNISYSYVPNLMWDDPQSTKPPAIVMLDRIGTITAAGSKWPKNGNHRNVGGNILFTDDHVEWATQLPSALKDKNGHEIVLSP